MEDLAQAPEEEERRQGCAVFKANALEEEQEEKQQEEGAGGRCEEVLLLASRAGLRSFKGSPVSNPQRWAGAHHVSAECCGWGNMDLPEQAVWPRS